MKTSFVSSSERLSRRTGGPLSISKPNDRMTAGLRRIAFSARRSVSLDAGNSARSLSAPQSAGRLLLVSFTENVDVDLVSIISARQADSAERHEYEEAGTPRIP